MFIIIWKLIFAKGSVRTHPLAPSEIIESLCASFSVMSSKTPVELKATYPSVDSEAVALKVLHTRHATRFTLGRLEISQSRKSVLRTLDIISCCFLLFLTSPHQSMSITLIPPLVTISRPSK